MSATKQESVIVLPPERKQARELAATDNSPAGLLRLAIDKNLDTDKLRELMTLEKEWRADQAKAAFNKAMAKFGALKQNIAHNRTGKAGKAGSVSYGYSDFPQMVKIITPWLTQCGLSFVHITDAPVMGDKGIVCVNVTCIIKHEDGHAVNHSFPAMPDGRLSESVSPSQLLQMAITYAKRQTLAMGLGLATAEDKHDDDSQKKSATITAEQVKEIDDMLTAKNADVSAFMHHFSVEKVADLTADQYTKAIKMLRAKKS